MACHDGIADFRRIARYGVEYAIRHPRFLRQRKQRKGTQRRVIGRFYHPGAARRQRRAELTGQHRHREIPRRDCRHDTNRFTGRQDAGAGFDRRDDFTVGTLRLFGKPLDKTGCVLDLALGFFQRFPLFGGHQPSQPAFVFDNQFIPAVQNCRALFCRFCPPGRKCLTGRRNSLLGLLFSCFRHLRDRFAGRRIEHVKGGIKRFPPSINQISRLKKFVVLKRLHDVFSF